MKTDATAQNHGDLMDAVYRGQRHIYDASRKYFLFGRDKLLSGLNCSPDMRVIEIGCGTGRNLAETLRRWPAIQAYGLDISHEMLKSARQRLGEGAKLAHGDATGFDPVLLFGQAGFDRVVISYALSMIPDWRGAVRHSLDLLAPGGTLHAVDFGAGDGLPLPLRWALRGWLRRFHVEPRLELAQYAAHLAATRRWNCRTRIGPWGYFTLIRITRRDR